jgi:SAM-dependent methyltransferase
VAESDFGPATYGERWAEVYDEWVARLPLDTPGAVEFLAGMAGTGPVLELAIGTGRVSIPLAQRGIEVRGIDASEAMVRKLRAKPGGESIPVTIGDFADVAVEGRFPLIYVVFNTLFALLAQEDQVRCFRNVAEHLSGDGAFVLEAFVPDVARFDRGQRTDAVRVGTDHVYLDAARLDPLAQRVDSQAILIEDGRVRLFPVKLRFAWPSELDLMARLAGLRLRERFASWDRHPFTATSGKHISVYEATG